MRQSIGEKLRQNKNKLKFLATSTATALLSVPIILAAGGTASAAPTLTGHQAYLHRNVHVCSTPSAHHASCNSILHQRITPARKPAPNASSPTGLSPATIKSVYGFPTSLTAGAGQTVAIVDAYDAPNIESDLAAFSSEYGLPACTTSSGCFTKVSQNGSTNHLPRKNSGWALEISLDVEWVHAIAPNARIVLVEANSNSFSDLFAAEDYAAAHASYVSNSWGGAEFSGEASYDSHFSRPGVSYFVSSGDNGTPAEYPSASPNVISVGGTTLTFNSDSSVTETGWADSGGGCSAYETANATQNTGSIVNCAGMRATPDVALDADPNSGVSVYDSTGDQGQSGWFTVGGTSAAAPMWAARSAIAGATVDASYIYGSNITFHDVTSGDNGLAAGAGYDLVTGLGSWDDGTRIVGASGGTTVTAPSTPQLSATAGDGVVNLNWSISSNGGDPSVTYDLYRDGALLVANTSQTTYQDSTVTNGVQYSYYVTASNSAGTSAASNTVTATPEVVTTTTVHVGTIQYSQGHGHSLLITVPVLDSNGAGVAGVSVSITVDLNGSAYASGTATTGSDGTVTFQINHASKGAYSTVVTSVTGSDITWNGTYNDPGYRF